MKLSRFPLCQYWHYTFESSLIIRISLNSLNSVTLIFVIIVKELERSTSCVRDKDATAAQARHTRETQSFNWAQFMLQCFITFPEFAEVTEFNERSAPFGKEGYSANQNEGFESHNNKQQQDDGHFCCRLHLALQISWCRLLKTLNCGRGNLFFPKWSSF